MEELKEPHNSDEKKLHQILNQQLHQFTFNIHKNDHFINLLVCGTTCLSTFHRCIVGYEFELNLKRIVFSSGSVVGIRYPRENISGQRPPYPEPEEENSKSAAAITENQLDASGRSSSERSSGDGEESLYATIRYLSAGKMQM